MALAHTIVQLHRQPGVTVTEYEKLPACWIGKTIPSFGQVDGFVNGEYMVNGWPLKHCEVMNLISEAS